VREEAREARVRKPKTRPVGRPNTGSREKLLDAASALMIERDSIDVPVADIAERAGLNPQLIRYYFGGKQGLLVALLHQVATKALAGLKALVLSDLPPVRKLEMHLAGIVATYFRYPYTNRLLHALLLDEDATASAEVTRFFVEPLVAGQAELLRMAAEAGCIRRVDPMLFYFSVIGACDFLFSSRHTLEKVFGVHQIGDDLRRRYARHMADLVLSGLRPDTRVEQAA
jgi:AcrR family transcriptional regulator